MSSKWHQKKEKQRLEQMARDEEALQDEIARDAVNAEKSLMSDVAMGGGEEELFERKMTKEEKKAAAKAAREAKRKAKKKGKKEKEEVASVETEAARLLREAKETAAELAEGSASMSTTSNPLAEALASEGTICTFSTSKKGVDARSRDINIQNFTLQHKGTVMLDETEIVLNHGNRYGLIGRNGCGKSTLMKALGARAVPIPEGIDVFHLKEEIEASDTVTALEAVMSVDEERARLEKEVEKLNAALEALTDAEANGEGNDNDARTGGEEDDQLTAEEQQEQIMELLTSCYHRLDALDADTAETRARSILKGLGFTHDMQSKKTRDFSGGWRMRVSLARALFIQPTLMLLDEPTNHLDMEAVIWLEDYLSTWDKILFLISHSQDFLNNVCTHMVHFTNHRKLEYYDGNYDQFVKTKSEKEENQLKQYKWEQDQIKSMKEYIARFGHGTSKNAKQAQSKEKVLEKMVRAGLTEKPVEEKPMNFKFPDPGHLPPPVLAFHDVSFHYPKCEDLYTNLNFGVDLDSRVALVGPNGAGKTTLVKLMSGELQPSLGDIRPHGHLKMGRFTQHFVDVLDLDLTPLEFFGREYPSDTREDLRKYLGRFGVSGKMQVQKMDELSDGQKSRVVFAKLGRDVPHILLLDEPTNHLDMESIDALAKAVNEFEGGMLLVSHDMRLISQVAKEIWICDHKTVTPYRGDIQNFKMDMRAQMGIQGKQKGQLRGDASVVKKDVSTLEKERKKKEAASAIKKTKAAVSAGKGGHKKKEARSGVGVSAATALKPKERPHSERLVSVPVSRPKPQSHENGDAWGSDEEETTTTTTTSTSSTFGTDSLRRNIPSPSPAPATAGRYVPPHLRNR